MKFTYGQLFWTTIFVWVFLILNGYWCYWAIHGEPVYDGKRLSFLELMVACAFMYDVCWVVMGVLWLGEQDFWYKEINLDKIKKHQKK